MAAAAHASPAPASCADHDNTQPKVDRSSLKAAGDAAAKAGDWRAAADAYSAALACLLSSGGDPQLHGALLTNRCLAQLRLGEAAAALGDARQAIRVRPRWGKAHLRLGQALQACDDAAAAAEAFQRAAELDPELEAAAASAMAAAERDASRRRCTLVLQGRSGPLYDAAVCPQALAVGRLDTRLIATGGSDGNIRLWCSVTGRQLQLLNGHTDRVTRLTWSPCGSLLASASLDGTVRLWQMQGSSVMPGLGSHPGGGSGGDGTGTAPAGGELLLLAPAGGPVVSIEGGRPSCLAFSPDSSLLAVGTSEGAVWLAGIGAATGADGCSSSLDGCSLNADSCSSDADGCSSASSAGNSNPSAVWRCQKLKSHGALVSAVSFSPCSRLLASASGDGLCKLWDAASGSEVAEIAAESGPVNHCTFVLLPSPPVALPPSSSSCAGSAAALHFSSQRPASLLVTCHINQQRQEGRVLLWDAVGRRHGWVDGQIRGPVASLDDFQGKVVAAEGWCSDQADAVASGTPAGGSSGGSASANGPRSGGSSSGGARSAGALLATACTDGTVKAFDLLAIAALAGSAVAAGSKAAKRTTAPLWEYVLQGSFGAGGGADVPAWSAAAMRQAAHERNRLAVSPDGRQLAVCGPDLRLLVVDAESGEQLAALAGHSAAARALRWLAPDRLLSASEDGIARMWNTGH